MAALGSKRREVLFATASAVLGLLSLAAPAQAADAQDDTTVLPELVITSERRVQNLQEVPVSATVMTAAQLAESGVTSISDMQRVAPSVAINTYNRSTFINIRGIGIAQSAPTSTPGVAYYLNGALIPHEQTISMSFFDLESIQVLRGPQGTLTGQNSTGGAIYVTTPKPRIGDFSGYIDQTFSNYAGSRTIGAVNVPMGERFAMRVAGTVDRRDSFTTNLASPSQPGNVNVAAIRADLLFKPTERVQANLRYEKFRNHTDYNAVKRRNDTVSTDPFTIEEDAISNFLQDGYRAELETRWDVTKGLQWRADVNYQYGVNQDLADGDRSATATTGAPQNGRLGYAHTIFNTLIAETDLISTGEGPLQWVAGAFYLTEQVPVALLTYGNNRVSPTSAPTRTTVTKANNASRSVFGQATYKLNDAWEIIAGARYSVDEQKYERLVPGTPTLGVAKSNNTTGRVAVNYHLNDDTLIYGSVARGYKAGGVNLGATDPPFDPETNVVEELGVKTTILGGHLRINGDVFMSQYKNLQLSSLTAPPPNGTPTTHNVPKSKSIGAELELTGVFGELDVNGGVAYLDAQTDVDAGLSNNTGIGSTYQTVPAGTGLPFSPHVTANAGAQYRFKLGGGALIPRVQMSYLSDQYASVFRNINSLVPAHTTYDARISYESAGNWRAEVFMNNFTDRTYIASQLQDSSSTNGGIIYGAPRTYGARLVVKFD